MECTQVAALVVLTGTVILHIVDLAIPEWIVIPPLRLGLFNTCGSSLCVTWHILSFPGTFVAALMSISLLGNCLAWIMLIIYLCHRKKTTYMNVATFMCASAAIGCFVSFATWLGTYMVYGVAIRYFGAGLWVALALALLSIISAILCQRVRVLTAQSLPQAVPTMQYVSGQAVVAQPAQPGSAPTAPPPGKQPGYDVHAFVPCAPGYVPYVPPTKGPEYNQL